MWIIIVVVVGIAWFLYQDKKNSNSLSYQTLRPMSEWYVMAASSKGRQQRLMCWSLLYQASNTLEKLGFVRDADFKKLMKVKDFNPANFVISILEESEQINVDPVVNNIDIQLKEIFSSVQARTFLADCVIVILTKKSRFYPGEHQLGFIAGSSGGEQRTWGNRYTHQLLKIHTTDDNIKSF